jgi:ribonuclease HI
MDDAPKIESQPSLAKVVIYTDGAAEPNPGPGGYGVVLMSGGHRKELSGGFRLTTNNRMELLAVIVGLESLKRPCAVTIYSDSKYVVDSVERGSVHRWRKNNWFRTKTDRAKNADLWERFLAAYEKHKVRFKWVKGHAGIVENERCDVLAVAAAQSAGSLIDDGYLKELNVASSSNKVPKTIPLSGLAPTSGSTGSLFSDDAASVVSSENAPAAAPDWDTQLVHKKPGERCRKCGTVIVEKKPKPKARKPGQTYYYEWYLLCPNCKTMYMVDDAKRFY